jgi:hypothetical protein
LRRGLDQRAERRRIPRPRECLYRPRHAGGHLATAQHTTQIVEQGAQVRGVGGAMRALEIELSAELLQHHRSHECLRLRVFGLDRRPDVTLQRTRDPLQQFAVVHRARSAPPLAQRCTGHMSWSSPHARAPSSSQRMRLLMSMKVWRLMMIRLTGTPVALSSRPVTSRRSP